MADEAALVVAAAQRKVTSLITRVLRHQHVLHVARLRLRFLSAETFHLDLLGADAARALMAPLGAFVDAAVEELLARRFALENFLHGTLEGSRLLSAPAGTLDEGLADGVRSRMAAQRAGMLAVVGSSALIATRVRQVVAVHRRVLLLHAEAEIVVWDLRAQELTRHAPPLAGVSL